MVDARKVIVAAVMAGMVGLSGCGVTRIVVRPTVTPLESARFGPPCSVPTVTMGVSTFQGCRNLIIANGTAVTFDDPAATVSTGGGFHILVTGSDGQYQSSPGAPDALNSAIGVTFRAGTSQALTFTQPGTYLITCTLHPSMIVQVVVNP